MKFKTTIGLLLIIVLVLGFFVLVSGENVQKPHNYKENMRRIIMDKEPIENVLGEPTSHLRAFYDPENERFFVESRGEI